MDITIPVTTPASGRPNRPESWTGCLWTGPAVPLRPCRQSRRPWPRSRLAALAFSGAGPSTCAGSMPTHLASDDLASDGLALDDVVIDGFGCEKGLDLRRLVDESLLGRVPAERSQRGAVRLDAVGPVVCTHPGDRPLVLLPDERQ